jgi:competence protein ComGC
MRKIIITIFSILLLVLLNSCGSNKQEINNQKLEDKIENEIL